jgi:DNA-3-methyladenine glycosylase II
MESRVGSVHRSVLSAVPPYSLGASLRALSGFAPCAGDQAVLGDRVRKAFPLSASEAAVVEVAPRADDEPGVALSVYAARAVSADEAARLERSVSRWLGLDDDLTPYLAVARRDPAMRRILSATHGLHQVRFASLAEGTVYFTLTQRSTQWYAAARKRRIAAELGARLAVDGVEYVAFPDFPALSTVDFAGYAGNAARGLRVAEVVAGVAALDEEWLRTAPYAEARDALLHVRGVGTFTAHAILLRTLGRPDDTPLEMAQFTGVAEAVYGADPPSPTELREWYGPYVGWWAYLSRMGLGWLERDATGALRQAA